ncbi:MAG: hypothetical protein ACI8P3_003126 [Saprospiraceae bacterium]|jgi:hypothetical protein
MYKVILIVSIAVLFSYCGGEPSNNVDTATSTTETSESVATPVKQNYEASHEAPYCKLWVIKHAGGVDDLKEYKGRWFNLKTDGSFESGKWGETNNGGTWSIEKPTMIIRFVFNTPETIPSNWQIQGGGGGGRILFKGNVSGNERGFQVMLEPETVLPTQE